LWAEIDGIAASLADGAQKKAEEAIAAAPSLEALQATMAGIDAQVQALMAQVPVAPADMLAAAQLRFDAEPKTDSVTLSADVAQLKATLAALGKAVA
jgi:hypothetical protein